MASRISAERFNFVRRAATSGARNSLASRTTWIVSNVDPTARYTPQWIVGGGASFLLCKNIYCSFSDAHRDEIATGASE
jgi:hypothetical protein